MSVKSPELAVVFDMDGVLIDSVSFNWRIINGVLADYGAHVESSEIGSYLGLTWEDQLRKLNTAHGLGLRFEEFWPRVADAQVAGGEILEPTDGTIDLLADLQAHEIPMAVGTSTDRERTDKRLREAGLLQYFMHVVTRNDVKNQKPDPEIYAKAIELLGLAPRHSVVVEDSPLGIDAGLLAGARTLAISTPYTKPEDLYHADMVVPSMRHITVPLLRQLVS